MPAASRIAERAPSAATRSRGETPRRRRNCTSMRSAPASKPATASARSSTPSALARSTSASTSAGFSIMCANGSPGATSPPNVRNVGRIDVLQLGIGDDHVEDRLRVVRDLVPDADGLEQPPRRRRDRRGARVARMALAERRIGDRDLERIAEPLAQRDRERQPAKPPPAISTSAALGQTGPADRFVFAMAEVYHWHRNQGASMSSAVQTCSPSSTSNSSR